MIYWGLATADHSLLLPLTTFTSRPGTYPAPDWGTSFPNMFLYSYLISSDKLPAASGHLRGYTSSYIYKSVLHLFGAASLPYRCDEEWQSGSDGRQYPFQSADSQTMSAVCSLWQSDDWWIPFHCLNYPEFGIKQTMAVYVRRRAQNSREGFQGYPCTGLVRKSEFRPVHRIRSARPMHRHGSLTA